ncbi:MAG: threonine/serine dehydratase [Rhodospirillales bacterium]|nr:threonine/serine dehydratase [Rhodospirillales bacterium]
MVIDDIRDAANRIEGHALRTPLLESFLLNERLGVRLLVKPEVLQRTGSFKFRGAYTKISRLEPSQRKNGVVAYSSGNHAQGVAAAAALLGIRATIVMPEDAPRIKIENTKALGAEVILYDRYTENREAIGDRLCNELGAILVPPYDDLDVIAGQGTVGLEIAEDMAARGLHADKVIIPCGGGGLAAGTTVALATLSPDTDVWVAEPEAFDDTVRSLVLGERVGIDPAARTICDALSSPLPGEITFDLNRKHLTGGVAISEHDVAEAMVEAFRTFKIVVEPGGAVALAAVLKGHVEVTGQTVVVICSGGNVDPDLFSEILAGKRVF